MLTLYVHIPFCKARCPYCDFYLVTQRDHITAFFKALTRETVARSAQLKGETIRAIHFGGGTPSMVPVHYLAAWLNNLAGQCTFAADIEIALEANPEDLDSRVMAELHEAGVTRLSLGVQSFTDEKLRMLGRQHSASDAQRVTMAAMQRFHSVSVDLICGVPNETHSLWVADLQTVWSLAPHHLSVYMLSVEPKTMLHKKVACGLFAVPDDGVQASFYETAIQQAFAQGYSHYEISNFCLPDHHSRYNLASWKREAYLGFGPSAHSFFLDQGREIREANVSSLSRYLASPENAVALREELTAEERFTEQVFLSLRINSGLDVEFLRKENKLGHAFSAYLEQFIEKGWMVQHKGLFYLTDKGFLFADYITEVLLFG